MQRPESHAAYCAERSSDAASDLNEQALGAQEHAFVVTEPGVRCYRCGYTRSHPIHTNLEADFVHALDLHKERIRLLQIALCECQHPDLFQADLHDESCPVYEVAQQQREEYQPRV